MTAPLHLLPDLALVAKDQSPPNPDALVSAGLAYWRVSPTGRSLRPTLEGRTMLETQAHLDATRPLCLEIGALKHRLAVAEARAAYWKAEAQLGYLRGLDGRVIDCRGADEAKRDLDRACEALERLGGKP